MAKILVVDDSKFMRMILKNYFEKDSGGQNQVIGEAENGDNAITMYKALNPDLVTMDIIMPVESGLQVVKEILDYDKSAKIIMVSAMGQEKICEEALSLGAKGFVIKPVKAQELLACVKKLFEGKV